MGAVAHDANLLYEGVFHCLKDQDDTWYVKLKLGTVHEWEHLVSLFNINFCPLLRLSLLLLSLAKHENCRHPILHHYFFKIKKEKEEVMDL